MALFEDFDWQKGTQTFEAFWNKELDRPLVIAYGNSRPLNAIPSLAAVYNPFMTPEQIVGHVFTLFENTTCYGDALPIFWPNFGPGIAAAMTDQCDIRYFSDSVWFDPKEIKPLAELTIAADLNNIWFQKVKNVTELAIEKLGPYVHTGMTDLGGILDLISLCRTPQNLLMDLIDCPAEVKRVTEEFHQAWWIYYNALTAVIATQNRGYSPWALTWSKKPANILQCDFAFMISPEMFREFVLPELKTTIAGLERSFFHLDGPGMVPHLYSLLEIDALNGIQWIPGAGAAPADTWSDLIHRILECGKLVQLFVTCHEAVNAVKKYGKKNIMYVITELLTEENAQRFLTEINSIR